MAAGNFSGLPAIEKLQGRENYSTWQFAVQTYLEHEELWDYVLGTATDTKKDLKAKSKIILLIDPINYVHIQNVKTSKEVWDKLKSAFEDSGLTRRIGLLRALITTRLENCTSTEDYVNKIISTAHKLGGIGFMVSDEWVGTFLLAGLPDEYRPMIMGIESSGITITGDAIKTKLLQDVKTTQHSENAFFNKHSKSRRQHHKGKGPRCFSCNNYGHKANECNSKNAKEKSKAAAFCVGFSTGNTNKEDWYIDSGASMHMTMREDWLENKTAPEVQEIVVANNSVIPVAAAGTVNIDVFVNNIVSSIEIRNVQHVPNLSTNLLSVSQIVKNGHTVRFDNTTCKIFNGKQLVATADLVDNMYKLNISVKNFALASSSVKQDSNLWHRRLGHLNFSDLNKLQNGLVSGVEFSNKDDETCVPCIKGKQCRLPFKNVGSRAAKTLELIHSDLCGPMETVSIGGARYFFTLIDDFSRKVFVYFLQSKTQVPEVFENFKIMVENQLGNRIKTLRTDNGTEYCNAHFDTILRKSGIRHQTSTPYTPQQNGLAERMNRTIVEKAKCMLFDAKLSKEFWAEATSTAVYLINRSPSKSIEKAPEEMWSGKKPNLSNLKVFGCRAMVHIPKQKRQKWDPKSTELIFVGYCEDTKGYRLIRPGNKKLVKSRDVIFIEDHLPKQQVLENNPENVPVIFEEASEPVGEPAVITGAIQEDLHETEDAAASGSSVTIRRSQRQPKPKKMEDYVVYSASACQANDPETVAEALLRPDAENWKEAMAEEYKSLVDNNTWSLTDLPRNRKQIGCKWVFKTKKDTEGQIQRYKARLVIKGCVQKKGIDYQETYSPVVRHGSIRYLIALAAKYNLDIDQMDAVTAFLQGDLEEEVYMAQPQEFQQGLQVCRLNKAIYGLKQASRQWNKKLDSAIKEFGLTQSNVDPCIYFNIKNQSRLYVAVYVDDLLIFTNNINEKNRLKTELSKQFKMKDLGEAHSCVGLRITRDRNNGKIYLDQQQYTEEILTRFNMFDCKPVATPADPNQKLTKAMSPKDEAELQDMSQIPYQEAVGSILYLSQGTRPDIAYAVNTVSKYNNNPGKAHWTAVKRIFRYLKGTVQNKLEFSEGSDYTLKGYCDADWASESDERRSCTAYVFINQGGAISWSSKRQPTVALSTTEAEYMALSSATQEALWLQQLGSELEPDLFQEPIDLFCDNKSAINLATTDAYHARTKHIDVRHHFLREKVEDKTINLIYISTEDMVADSLTKATPIFKHVFCYQKMGLIM